MRKTAALLALFLLLSACSQDTQSAQSASARVITSHASSSPSEEENAGSSQQGSSEPDEAPLNDAEPASPNSSGSTPPDEDAQAAREAAEKRAAAERALAEQLAQEEAAKAAAEAQAAAERAAAEKAAAEQAAAQAAAEQAASDRAAAEQAVAGQDTATAAAEQSSLLKSREASAPEKAAAPKSTSAVSGVNFLSKVETAVLKLQNQERARLGLQPLELDPNLQSAARIRSREMYKNGYFAHERPDGQNWSTVITEDIPIDFISAGENLCTTEYDNDYLDNADNASFWVQQWIDSPTHYENMIKPEFNRAGVGIYCITKNGITTAYATTLYSYTAE